MSAWWLLPICVAGLITLAVYWEGQTGFIEGFGGIWLGLSLILAGASILGCVGLSATILGEEAGR